MTIYVFIFQFEPPQRASVSATSEFVTMFKELGSGNLHKFRLHKH